MPDEGGHGVLVVFREMLLHVMWHFKSLPEPRSLSLDEIATLYDFMRDVLKAETKPKPNT